MKTAQSRNERLIISPVATFLFGTYGLSWAVWFGLLACSSLGLTGADVPGRYYGWGGVAPSLVAMLLALRAGGWPEAKRLASRVTEWRVPIRWYLYALLTPVLIRLLGIALHAAGGGAVRLPSVNPVMVVVVFMVGLIVPLMEEYGWRGYLQPRLRRRWNAVSVGLAVGVAWWGWHVPLFWIEGTSLHSWGLITGVPLGLVSYAVSVIALSMLFTLMYENTEGTLLLAFLLHTSVNVSADLFSSAYREMGETPPLLWTVLAITAAGWAAVWMLRRSSRRAGRADGR